MRAYEPYTNELTYTVPADRRDEYTSWLRAATGQWIVDDRLDGFHCEQTLTGTPARVRLVFEFETLVHWAAFVTSDAFRRCIDQLRALTGDLETDLWEPTPISLGTPRRTDHPTRPTP